jgi:type I restriction enzyme M protein
MAKTPIKADISIFEQELWKAANELCGAVAENQYKASYTSFNLLELAV